MKKPQFRICFSFAPPDYFLCKSPDKSLGEYSLNYRIDRSKKGKEDDVGMPKIYLTEEEAQMCRENGFAEII